MCDLKTILLPVDFSDRSLEAAREAKGIARHVRCRLVVLNVAETRISELQFEPGGSSAQELWSYFNRELREIPVEYAVEPGAPAQVIDQVAREDRADLILMAGHNRKPFEAFALGSVTAGVLYSAACPVWVSFHAERGSAPLFRRILCPAGLSESSGAALDWALRFAHAFDAACDVIQVTVHAHNGESRSITEDSLRREERATLDTVRQKLDGRGQVILTAGDPETAIAAAAADLKSNLVVMGRGQPGNEIARVRSLPMALARRAPCPVVVV